MSDLEGVILGEGPSINRAPDSRVGVDSVRTLPLKWQQSSQYAEYRRAVMVALLTIILSTAGGALYVAIQQYDIEPRINRLAADVDSARNRAANAEADVARLSFQLDNARANSIAAPGDPRDRDRDGVIEGDIAASTAGLSNSQDVARLARSDLTRAESDLDSARRMQENLPLWWIILLGAVVALSMIGVVLVTYLRSEKRREWQNQIALTNLRSEESTASDQLAAFETLWHQNQARLQEYHTIVVNYAASSRQSARVIIGAGFILILAVGAFALLARDTASAISASVVASTGAAVTGFIARAVLKNAESSSRELLAFFSHPLHMERILAAERIVATMSGNAQDVAKIEVVRGIILTPHSWNSNRAPDTDSLDSFADSTEARASQNGAGA